MRSYGWWHVLIDVFDSWLIHQNTRIRRLLSRTGLIFGVRLPPSLPRRKAWFSHIRMLVDDAPTSTTPRLGSPLDKYSTAVKSHLLPSPATYISTILRIGAKITQHSHLIAIAPEHLYLNLSSILQHNYYTLLIHPRGRSIIHT